jgi:N6-L-threonylcarbamoyladenine synthase
MSVQTILGIESSCDDTSIAIIRGETNSGIPEVLAHQSFSQEAMLSKWGGVVPEIAARNHLAKLAPLLKSVLEEAKIKPSELDSIGVTTHPGLLGPLLTGLNSAKTLAMLYELPINPINHLYAHLEAIHLSKPITYPYLGLLVSGGHSLYFLVESALTFTLLGTTIDDAAGEAFDKGGKLLGLGYPAGRIIDELAQKGNELVHPFPVGLKKSGDANLSYSGLKTSLRDFLVKNPDLVYRGGEYSTQQFDLCASYQKAIVDALVLKLSFAEKKAFDLTGIHDLPLVVGGGVACNSYLRTRLQSENSNCHFVEPKYCTDNGAMIANYALRISDKAISYPDCLYTDARGRFISKSELLEISRKRKLDAREKPNE